MICTVRVPRGDEEASACGQLRLEKGLERGRGMRSKRPASSLRTRPPLMQQAGGDGGGEEEPLQTTKEEPQATGDGSTNYPWYIPDKKEEAWRPGEEADVTSVLDAFNQGFNFNKNLKKERGWISVPSEQETRRTIGEDAEGYLRIRPDRRGYKPCPEGALNSP